MSSEQSVAIALELIADTRVNSKPHPESRSAVCASAHTRGRKTAGAQVLKFISPNITLKVNFTPAFGEFKAHGSILI